MSVSPIVVFRHMQILSQTYSIALILATAKEIFLLI